MRCSLTGALGALAVGFFGWAGDAIAGPYAPAAGQPGSTAIHKDDASIQAWATGHVNYLAGAGVSAPFNDPTKAHAKAEGTSFDIVSLGDAGQITLTFAAPIADGAGADFAVFENGFSDTFLELAWVEVSDGGTTFVRFANDSLTPSPVPFLGGSVDPTNINGLAGKYRQAFGTPFDLADVGLSQVTHVRLLDIVGDGTALDTSGDVIYDPYPTSGSAGFDLDAVGVIHQVPEPAGAALALLPLLALASRRRGARVMTCLAAAALCASMGSIAAAQTVDFDDLALPSNSHHDSSAFSSRGASFNNTSGAFGWSGFAYSNQTDTMTPGFSNQHSAITGTGASASAIYGVAYFSAFDPAPTITLPAGRTVESVSLTNTTYAYLSMRDGDAFAKKFGGATGSDPDYLRLTITGLDASDVSVGAVDFYLADYRFADGAQDYIVSTWQDVDVSSLSGARKLTFGFDSSDVGAFGINTPTYVALDDLVTVPEPAAIGFIGFAALAALRRRR